MKFRRKTLEMEAEQYKPGMEDGFLHKYRDPNNPLQLNKYPRFEGEIPVKIPYIRTRYGGKHRIREGDWIITFAGGSKEVMDTKKLFRNYEAIEGE